MGIRRKARECALQILFQSEYSPPEIEELLDAYWSDHRIPDKVRDYTGLLVRGVHANIGEIDTLITKNAHNWRIDRMTKVDRNILRVAVYEFLSGEGIPKRVVINEALEIAKKFSTSESAHFINGVLDGIKNAMEEGQ
jgi:N utilization substance protein B